MFLRCWTILGEVEVRKKFYIQVQSSKCVYNINRRHGREPVRAGAHGNLFWSFPQLFWRLLTRREPFLKVPSTLRLPFLLLKSGIKGWVSRCLIRSTRHTLHTILKIPTLRKSRIQNVPLYLIFGRRLFNWQTCRSSEESRFLWRVEMCLLVF